VTGASEGRDAARRAYEALAPSYDDFTLGYGYRYESWVTTLLAKVEEEGVRGNRLLDLACGTGFSFIPLLERGWRVTACDVSAAMIEAARAKVGERAELLVVDMRDLPRLGEFDLVWALNSSFNYLLSAGELRATLEGVRRNLAGGGLALFDLVTLRAGRAFLSAEIVVEKEGRRLVWRGQVPPEEVRPGLVGEGRFEVEGKGEADSVHVHRLRHFPKAEVTAAIGAAGLRCVSFFGEKEGSLLPDLDEEAHATAVYLCRV
jgi:SAM-dependent methyltransferase